MSAPTIPKGWRRLRVGSIRRKGDRIKDGRRWVEVISAGTPILEYSDRVFGPYIRRIRKKAGK
jgi:hypothetical protein